MALEQTANPAPGTLGLLDTFFDSGSYTPLFGGGKEGLVAAFGQVSGQGAYAICQKGVALRARDTLLAVKTLQLAAKTGNPVVTFYHSPGANLSEGLAPLAAARDLAAAAGQLSGVVPQIAVVCGVCGASSTLAALESDLLVMTKDAEFFLTAPFFNEDPPESLSGGHGKREGAGTTAAAMAAGVVAHVADNAEEAARFAAKLVAMLPQNNISPAANFEYMPPTAVLDMKNYTGKGAIEAVADAGSVEYLFSGSGPNAHVALATLAGNVVGFVATHTPDSYLCKKCIPKLTRFVRLCDAYSIPIITLLNTGGFKKSASGEVDGALREAGRLAATYADATTAKLLIVTGHAVGPIYTAFCNADLSIAVEGCVIAPVEPTAAVTILYKEEIEAGEGSIEAETKARAALYETEVASAGAALAAGLADMVAAPEKMRATAEAALDILMTKRTQRLPKKHGNMPL